MARGRFIHAFLGGLSISLSTSGVLAQTPPDESGQGASEAQAEDPTLARAREAFVLGTALAREGQWLDALAAFERSARLRAHPVTTYNLAYCERALGRYTRARQLFKRALEDHAANRGGNLSEELVAQAQSYLAEIERRVARATITVTPAGATLSVDGRGLEPAEAGSAGGAYIAGTGETAGAAPAPRGSFELLLDPGRHIFVVSHAGSPERVVTETFNPGERRRLELSSGAAGVAVRTTLAPQAAPGRDYTWPILAYGVGAAGLTVGTIFGIATFNKEADLAERCPAKNCPAESQPELDTADRYALVANIGFGVGVAGMGLGTFLLFAGGDERLPGPSGSTSKGSFKSSLRAWVSPTSAGIRGAF